MKAGVSKTDTPVISCQQIFCEGEYLLGTNRKKTFIFHMRHHMLI